MSSRSINLGLNVPGLSANSNNTGIGQSPRTAGIDINASNLATNATLNMMCCTSEFEYSQYKYESEYVYISD